MPLRSLREVDRRPLAGATADDLRRKENALDPFVLTDCTAVVPVWAAFGRDVRGFLRGYAPVLDITPTEVAAMMAETTTTVSQAPGHVRARDTLTHGSNASDGCGGLGCREAPRYYGGHHDVRVHAGSKVMTRVPCSSGRALDDSPAVRSALGATKPTSSLSSPAPGSGYGSELRSSPELTVLDARHSHGDTLAALDVSESQFGDLTSSRRMVFRWTGGVDILDDPQQVHHGLLEQRVHQLAAASNASPSAVKPLVATPAPSEEPRATGVSSARGTPPGLDEDRDENDRDAHSEDSDDHDAEAMDEEATDALDTSTAAPRVRDRRPELTLEEALRVMEHRQSSRSSVTRGDASLAIGGDGAEASADLWHDSLANRITSELRDYPGALYLKAPLSSFVDLCESLELGTLLFAGSATGKAAVKPSALTLQGTSYAAWVFVGEKGAGTRSHANISGSHGWHVLLRGTKKWRIVHPLDRQLVCSRLTGALSDAFQDSSLPQDAQRHARVFEVTQHAGEALFLPSEAVYCDLCLEDTVAIHMNFYDATTMWQERRFKRLYTFLLAPTNRDAMFPTLVPLTMVDLVLFADNVYPSFRGKNRTYRPDTAQSVVVVRGFAEFTQVRLPCSELGARVELEAMQACFGPLGKCMMERFSPSRYAIGVPKGYIVCEKEHRLQLYYYVKAFSLDHIREALAHADLRKATEGGRRPLQWFTRDEVTLPDIEYFRSTCSHQGLIPNYVPLSVLLAQSWPFERDLCRYLVSLPRIILDKAYNQRGFIRPGSVWHYSRFDLDDDPADRPQAAGRVAAAPSVASQAHTQPYTVEGGHHTALLLHPGSGAERTSRGGGDACTPPGSASTSTEGDSHRTQPWPQPNGEAETFSTVPSSFAHSFVNVEAVEHQPGAGWCRTFLFYCSSLLDTPVAMHPITASRGLQDSESLLSNGIRSKFHPRILEFAWNVNMLEEYGLVSLLQLETTHETAEAVIARKILGAPCFPSFEDFLELHGLHRPQPGETHFVEKVMAAVLWFTCTPCIVGFVSGTSAGVTRSPAQECDGAAPTSEMKGDAGTDERPLTTNGGQRYVPLLDSDSDEPRGKWDTVCLTATAASVLLECVPASPYAIIASRLSNWLCDEYEEQGEVRQSQVLDLVRSYVSSHEVERQAVVFEVLRIKRRAYEQQLCDACTRTDPAAASLNAAATPPYDCRHVNIAKLEMVESMCADFELRPPSRLPCFPPSL